MGSGCDGEAVGRRRLREAHWDSGPGELWADGDWSGCRVKARQTGAQVGPWHTGNDSRNRGAARWEQASERRLLCFLIAPIEAAHLMDSLLLSGPGVGSPQAGGRACLAQGPAFLQGRGRWEGLALFQAIETWGQVLGQPGHVLSKVAQRLSL